MISVFAPIVASDLPSRWQKRENLLHVIVHIPHKTSTRISPAESNEPRKR